MVKLIDLTGQRFGQLTVIERTSNAKNNSARWLCKCDCGENAIVLGSALYRGITTSCKKHNENCFVDITGQRFGQLVVIKRLANTKVGSARWLCQCDCGGYTTSASRDLRNGHTQKCKSSAHGILIDITGQRFGQLTVLSRSGTASNGEAKWLCRCDCGNTLDISGAQLRFGYRTVCSKKIHSPLHIKDGQRFGMLVVIEHQKDGLACRCDCGTIVIISGSRLRSGKTIDCGCMRAERQKQFSTKHGLSTSQEYNTWSSIIQRCTNDKCKEFKNYGGRGIKVCEQWKNFEIFYTDMGPKPTPKHSIDRIDNDGNYEPGNCRWATREEQSNNRRTNRKIGIGDQLVTIAQASRITGVSDQTISDRLKRGMSDEDAIKPVKKK